MVDTEQRRQMRRQQGDRIRRQRIASGMTMLDLAERLHVTDGSVGHWETGRFSPRPETQLLIAAALGVSWSDLFSLDEAA